MSLFSKETFLGGIYTVTYAKGYAGGGAPYQFTLPVFPTVQELYLCLTGVQSGGGAWNLNGTTATKWIFLRHNKDIGKNKSNNYINWARTIGLEIQQAGPSPNQFFRSKCALTDMQPHTVEVYCRANTPGLSDGDCIIHVDGKQVLNVGSVMYTAKGQPAGFNTIVDNGTWGGGTNPVPWTLTRSIDGFYVSGR